MITTINEKHFLTQKVIMKKKYTNKEIKLYHFFHEKTYIYPCHVISHRNFVFFFVKNSDYFKAKKLRNSLRKGSHYKILIIRAENTLIRLLFGLFPDTYIHDITIDSNSTNKIVITLFFIFYKDRGIAIGRGGEYIIAVNEIFEKYIILKDFDIPIQIQCHFRKL